METVIVCNKRKAFVHESEAKQSRIVGGTLDCFVASLLAMTEDNNREICA
jgi:hypothetical protein